MPETPDSRGALEAGITGRRKGIMRIEIRGTMAEAIRMGRESTKWTVDVDVDVLTLSGEQRAVLSDAINSDGVIPAHRAIVDPTGKDRKSVV